MIQIFLADWANWVVQEVLTDLKISSELGVTLRFKLLKLLTVDTEDMVHTVDMIYTVETVYTYQTALHCLNISMYAYIFVKKG